MVTEAFAELEFRLPRLAEQGVGAVRMTRAAIEGRANPVYVHRRELADWAEPIPSAEQLRWGPPGARKRAESPVRPAVRSSDPRRGYPSRRPSAASEGPTLFENGG